MERFLRWLDECDDLLQVLYVRGRSLVVTLLLVVVFLGGCGKKGPPVPPQPMPCSRNFTPSTLGKIRGRVTPPLAIDTASTASRSAPVRQVSASRAAKA